MKNFGYLSKLISLIYKKHQNLLPFLEILRSDIAGIEFLDMGEDDTAFIHLENKKFYIRINNRYIKEYKLNDDDILWLICHEISHFVLGHHNSNLIESHSHQYRNFAFDCQVNSMLFNINKRNRIEFFDKNYADGYNDFLTGEDLTGFYFLLIPPLKTEQEIADDFRTLDYDPYKLAVIREFWFKNFGEAGLGAEAINEYLEIILPEDSLNNQPEENPRYDNELPAGIEELRELITEINRDSLTASSGFTGGLNNPFNNIDVKKRRQNILRRAMQSAFFEDKEKTISGVSEAVIQSVFPALRRKEAAMLGTGVIPMFYSTLCDTPSAESMAIYIDFSISTRDYHNEICKTLSSLRDVYKGVYYAFTTELTVMTFDELKTGRFESGGTDITPVIEHINKNKFKKVLLVTDGEFSPSPVKTHAEIYLLFFEKSNSPDAVKQSGNVKQIWHLEK